LSRPYFHETYIRTGRISVDRSNPRKPKVDTSELLRIFGKLKPIDNSIEDNIKNDTPYIDETIPLKLELERLRSENDGLKRLSDERLIRLNEKDSLLADKTQEIQHYRERISGLETRYDRLLEYKQPVQVKKEDRNTSFWEKVKAVFTG
jgi:hypothetical protein